VGLGLVVWVQDLVTVLEGVTMQVVVQLWVGVPVVVQAGVSEWVPDCDIVSVVQVRVWVRLGVLVVVALEDGVRVSVLVWVAVCVGVPVKVGM